MKRRLLPLVALAMLGAAPASAMTVEECNTMWIAADTNKDGVLNGAEADRYNASLRMADKPVPADGFNQPLFAEHCQADVFKTVAAEEGAPFAGANSFTEGQAQDRIAAAGLTGVSALKKDDNGVWRGTATRDGKQVNVAVDYKGNVVTQ